MVIKCRSYVCRIINKKIIKVKIDGGHKTRTSSVWFNLYCSFMSENNSDDRWLKWARHNSFPTVDQKPEAKYDIESMANNV